MKNWVFPVVLVLIVTTAAYPQQPEPLNPAWKTAVKSGEATISVYWYDNNPFFYKDTYGNLKGIEYEILEGFKDYVQTTLHVNLTIQWVELKSFGEVLQKIQHRDHVGIFGCAGLSITPERRMALKFSPSYMADIAVLVSTQDLPAIKTKSDFKSFSDATAVTIPGTLMESDLINLQETEQVAFHMNYVSNSIDFLNTLKNKKRAFGYLNLPVYLMYFKDGMSHIRRQNYFTKIKEGHGIGLPKNSDWDIPLNSYFKSPAYKTNIEPIISHYISLEFYHFVSTLTTENEIRILNKEKEIQEKEIRLQEFQIAERKDRQRFLTIIIAIGSVLLVIILFLFRSQLISNRKLKEQKDEIETQADEIKLINDYLELLVKQRTQDLEKKNQALEEYAFIVAHKLRAPLASILGLIGLLERVDLEESDKILLDLLRKSATGLDGIIHSVMDIIDGEEKSLIQKPEN